MTPLQRSCLLAMLLVPQPKVAKTVAPYRQSAWRCLPFRLDFLLHGRCFLRSRFYQDDTVAFPCGGKPGNALLVVGCRVAARKPKSRQSLADKAWTLLE